MTSFRNPSLLAALLLFLSSLTIRHQLMGDFGVTYSEVAEFKIWVGWMYDAIMAVLPFVMARLLWALRVPPFATWAAFSGVIWGAVVANASYFRFFGARLDWWTVKHQWEVIGDVEQGAGALLASGGVAISALLFIGALYFGWQAYRKEPLPHVSRRDPALQAALMLVVLLLIRQSPMWFNVINSGEENRPPVVTEHVITSWWAEATTTRRSPGESVRLEYAEAKRLGTPPPGHTLARFRDFSETRAIPDSPLLTSIDPAFPMLREFKPDSIRARKLQERFGLDPSRPVRALVLMLETVRAYEYLNPNVGPLIFPRLKKWVDTKGILFPQAYNSTLEMGQTVRGQFTVLCSNLPNWNAPAVFVQYSSVEVRCLPGLFQARGHRTIWFGGERSDFHNKSAFERLHGTDAFYGKEYFVQKGITEQIGDLGVADHPFYQETLNVLEKLSADGRPYFASITNTSTHYPWDEIKEGPVPSPLAEQTSGQYRGYLSRLKYLDHALGDFLDRFFASPVSDNAVVVLVGDHSNKVPPPWKMDTVANEEMQYRVFTAILSKNMRHPGQVLKHPVHQVDIAPTLAELAGMKAAVTWVGRSMFDPNGEGTPWLLDRDQALSYRTRSVGCYSGIKNRKRAPTCYSALGRDLLFDETRKIVPNDPKLEAFFREVTTASRHSLVLNLLAPRGVFEKRTVATAEAK